MGLRLRWGGGGERAPWLGTGRVGARVTAASGCAVPGRHGLGAQHQLPPASMWLGAAQEQTSRGQHPQRAQALPSPWCHQLLLAGSLVSTDEPWPGSMWGFSPTPSGHWLGLRQAVLPGAVKGLDSGGRSRDGERSMRAAGQGRGCGRGRRCTGAVAAAHPQAGTQQAPCSLFSKHSRGLLSSLLKEHAKESTD